MNRILSLLVVLASPYVLIAADPPGNVVLIIHGGAGLPERLDPETEKAWRADLETALKNGFAAMKNGNALDGVEAAIKVLEDSPR